MEDKKHLTLGSIALPSATKATLNDDAMANLISRFATRDLDNEAGFRYVGRLMDEILDAGSDELDLTCILWPALYAIWASLQRDPFAKIDAKALVIGEIQKQMKTAVRNTSDTSGSENSSITINTTLILSRITQKLIQLNRGYLLLRQILTRSLLDLHMSIAISQLFLECSDDDPRLSLLLRAHAILLTNRFGRLDNTIDIDGAISIDRRAVHMSTIEDSFRPSLLAGLAKSLRIRFQRFGELPDLEEAISALRQGLRLIPDTHSDRPKLLSDIGHALRTRFSNLGDVTDINEAVCTLRNAVALMADDHSDRFTCMEELGIALRTRFQRLSNLPDLADAIEIHRSVVALVRDGHEDKSKFLANLGNSLLFRFERFGDVSDLDEAIGWHRSAVELVRNGDPEMPAILQNLGTSLISRYERTHMQDDLESAVETCRSAVALTPNGHPMASSRLNNLGASLLRRFERFGDLDDLDSAISFQRSAVEITSDEHPDKPTSQSNLGVSLRIRFMRLGELADIEGSIMMHRNALNLTSDGDQDKPRHLASLAKSFHSRFRRLDDVSDLENAIAMQRSAVNLITDDNAKKPMYLTSLGNFLRTRCQRAAEQDDLENAITAHRSAVDLIPEGHPEKAALVSNLGNSFHTRFELAHQLEDLDSAITAHRSSVDLSSNDHLDRLSCLNNLAISLHTRFIWLGEISDIDGSIEVVRHAIELIPADHHLRAKFFVAQGISRSARIHVSHSQADFDLAYQSFADGLTSVSSGPAEMLSAALERTRLCAEFPHLIQSPNALLQAHKSVLDTIPSFIWLGNSVSHRYEQLSRLPFISHAIISAASAAISAGNFILALEWLEEGRSLIWGQLARFRSTLDDLKKFHPALAEELEDVTIRIQETDNHDTFQLARDSDVESDMGLATDGGHSPQSRHAAFEDNAADRRRLAQRYDQLLLEIRSLEGFGNFLCPKTLEQLAPACQDGPVVVINVHKSRCDALILCRPKRVLHVPLPNLSLADAEKMRSLLLKSTGSHEGRLRDPRAAIRPTDAGNNNRLRRILYLLWDRVVQPVLSTINNEVVLFQSLDGKPLPHVTWCATGPLAFLPLHAAGVYSSSVSQSALDAGGYTKASDCVVSSYTPSLSALLDLRVQSDDELSSSHPCSAPSSEPQILVISQPNTPGLDAPLPCTTVEAVKISAHFPQGVRHLEHEQATVASTVAAMQVYEWVHLACHGVQVSQGDPTKSAFWLYDGPLELSHLMNTTLAHAELAVLSACQSAKGDESLPEEAAHLAAGMLSVGYKSVIAAMWSINDFDGPQLADALYEALRRRWEAKRGGRLGAAYALHEAVSRLKESIGEDELERWVPFVHFGI